MMTTCLVAFRVIGYSNTKSEDRERAALGRERVSKSKVCIFVTLGEALAYHQ